MLSSCYVKLSSCQDRLCQERLVFRFLTASNSLSILRDDSRYFLDVTDPGRTLSASLSIITFIFVRHETFVNTQKAHIISISQAYVIMT